MALEPLQRLRQDLLIASLWVVRKQEKRRVWREIVVSQLGWARPWTQPEQRPGMPGRRGVGCWV